MKLTKAERALAKIARIYDKRTLRITKERGKKYSRTESTHAYYNLEGAIIDIERRPGIDDAYTCDKVSLRTLKRVATQLARIGVVLEEMGLEE